MFHELVNLHNHRVTVTVIASVIAVFIIMGGILSFVKKDTFIARRKATQYIVLATIGLLFYLRDNLAIVWTYPEYDSDDVNTFLYYLVAVPLHFLPVMVRSWRIYCIYRPTLNWKFQMDYNFAKFVKRRGHAWMFIRMGLWMIPWGLVSLLTLYDHTMRIVYYVYIGLEGVYAFLSLAINWKLYTIREELRPKFLDETKCLLIYSVMCVLEWLWTNTLYLIMQFSNHEPMLAIYIYGDLFFVFSIWALTGGRILYKVWKQNQKVDKKPDINCLELRYSTSKAPNVVVINVICSSTTIEGSATYTYCSLNGT